MNDYVKYIVLLFLLAIVQKTLLWLIAVTQYNITPDIIMIGLVYIAIKEGKIAGCVSGFLIGLIFDLFSFSFIGLMALSKCVAGFAAGYFNNENKIDRYTETYIFTFIVFFISLINNSVYFTFYFQGSTLSLSDIFLKYILPTAIYTCVLSIFPVIFMRKKTLRFE